ncbi:Sensory histidine kinase in two-component regulatory system with RstA [Moritella sp. JT01]|uniref:ATP-binding protein n=1 Tax=Moritella sp. JT01 TaxID=756698 RepID=UPI000796CB13|nr:ATP-binding protein [Moritella sp. JT01]KXO12921.1 Sensory histidine kinase in two-component regulatory system with RstA [Moritella sp. JT01]
MLSNNIFTNFNRVINRNTAHTLFFKLYLSITTVIIGSIVLFVIIIYNYFSYVEFVHNANFSARLLNDFEEGSERWDMEVDLLSQFTGFSIQTLSAKAVLEYHQQHQLLDVIDMDNDTPPLPIGIGRGGVHVYDNDNDKRLAVIIPSHDKSLLIIDTISSMDAPMDGPDYDDSEFLLLGLIFLSIAFVLYFAVKNISDHVYKLSLASLALANGQLDTRVDDKIPAPLNQMAVSFNKMAISLQYSQHQQKVMANAIAHELRTPLTRIQLVMGLLSDEEHSTYTTELHNDLSRYTVEMEALANDILMLQTIEHKPSSAHQIVDLSELMQSREIEFQRQYPHVLLSSYIDVLEVDANPRYLQLIVDNLVKNACLYADSTVKLSLKSDPEYFSIVVEDDGEGISPLQREQVLDAFTRLDNSRSRQTGGFGLGLAIVSTIVKTMKAEINIGTSELGGAMFVVKFKLDV